MIYWGSGDHRKVGEVNIPKEEISLVLREGTCCELSADGRVEKGLENQDLLI